MADIGSLFCNKVLQKQSAQKNESLEWLDFVSSISDFCWIFCTCHYGLDDMGYVAFWMMPKGNEKRETQQNPLLLSPVRSKKGNENRGNPRNPMPFSACEAGKGNEKRETQQNPLLLSPARSEKGNEKQRNPRNPLPLKQVWLPKGNQKRETQQNPLPLK
ncbi:MAG: hypothetical protein ACLTHS_01440 [Eubacterium sp.]